MGGVEGSMGSGYGRNVINTSRRVPAYLSATEGHLNLGTTIKYQRRMNKLLNKILVT